VVLTHHCRKPVLLTYLQELKQAKQELGGVSKQEMQAPSRREKPAPAPLRGQGQRAVPLQKWPELRIGPGTYKEALTNIKVTSRTLVLKISLLPF
jgi:hypothetical protein